MMSLPEIRFTILVLSGILLLETWHEAHIFAQTPFGNPESVTPDPLTASAYSPAVSLQTRQRTVSEEENDISSLILEGSEIFPNREDEWAAETQADSNPQGGRQNNYAVRSQSFTWHDRRRNRAVSFRMFYPVAPERPCPVVLFSHGLGGSADHCSYLGIRWARAGCVSFHLQHGGCDETVWKGKVRAYKELRDAYSRHWSAREQANDLRFVLDSLEVLVEKQATWNNLVDINHVGVAGYNLGSLAALLLAGQIPPDKGPSLHDARIKAVVALGTPVHQTYHGFQAAYSQIDVPCLFINGTEDDSRIGSTKAAQRRIPFDSIGRNEQFLIHLYGADHMSYSGHFLRRRAVGDAPYQSEILRLTTTFWQAYLHGDPEMHMRWTAENRRPPISRISKLERKIHGNDEFSP